VFHTYRYSAIRCTVASGEGSGSFRMRRLFKKGTPPLSREEIEKEAAAELAAATGLGAVASPSWGPNPEQDEPSQP